MSASGEHETETHPRARRRMLVAGCIALGLFIIALVTEGHAARPGMPGVPVVAGAAP